MISLKQGSDITQANPALPFILQRDGILADPTSLAWEIFDKTSAGKQIAPVSVASGTADLVLDQVSTGHFFARHTFDGTETIGLYEIRWTWVEETGGDTLSARYEFEIVNGAAGLEIGGGGYALVADIRAEGIGDAYTDARLQHAITLASRFVERVTGRFFEARKMVQRVSGQGAPRLILTDPVIGIDSIQIASQVFSVNDQSIDLSFVRVFNRHLDGMLSPDDRNAPKLEFAHSRSSVIRPTSFPRDAQNVSVSGFFGYTEDDGTPFGRTPMLIRHATKLIVMRELPTLSSSDRSDAALQWRITEERTRDQSVKYGSDRKAGSFTGDAEIDSILLMHVRPPVLGAA